MAELIPRSSPTSDLNELSKAGIFYGVTFSNAPAVAFGLSIVEVLVHNFAYLIQRFTIIDGASKTFWRRKNNNKFSEWYEI